MGGGKYDGNRIRKSSSFVIMSRVPILHTTYAYIYIYVYVYIRSGFWVNFIGCTHFRAWNEERACAFGWLFFECNRGIGRYNEIRIVTAGSKIKSKKAVEEQGGQFIGSLCNPCVTIGDGSIKYR
jgi:hypothetical protein